MDLIKINRDFLCGTTTGNACVKSEKLIIQHANVHLHWSGYLWTDALRTFVKCQIY